MQEILARNVSNGDAETQKPFSKIDRNSNSKLIKNKIKKSIEKWLCM
jgi:hypothetical protein